jgi:acetyl-CoA carboxylase biotin carboxyl carrier protein
MSGSSAFTNDDVEQILRVVDRLADVEVRIESGDLKLHVRKFSHSTSGPAEITRSEPSVRPRNAEAVREAEPVPPPARAGVAAPEVPDGAVAIRAPMLGRFFRAPSPSEPPYVEVGKRVGANDPVCLIEVMKLFTTVNAGVNGTIVALPVANGEMVEHGQVLFLVRPE